MLREAVAVRHGGFYTSAEFDLSGVSRTSGEIMELGRSCVEPGYRTGAVMQLLWRGIADYLDRHRIGLMLGCASLPGTDPEAVASVLSYLHHHHLAPARPAAARPPRALRAHRPAGRRGDRSPRRPQLLPPLLKAYLRMGGMIGEGAVIDRQFNTIDVCLVLPTDRVVAHYQRHYRQHRPVATAA